MSTRAKVALVLTAAAIVVPVLWRVGTVTAESCGYAWAWTVGDPGRHRYNHDCNRSTNHPNTEPHRCRCGATATRGDTE